MWMTGVTERTCMATGPRSGAPRILNPSQE